MTGDVDANLYVDGGYRVIHVVGPAFLLLSSGAFAVAALLLISGALVPRLGVAAVAVGALGGFAASRSIGVFGFTERGLQPAPQALISLISELGTLALLLCWGAMIRRLGPRLRCLAGGSGEVIITSDRFRSAVSLAAIGVFVLGAGGEVGGMTDNSQAERARSVP